MNAQTLNTFALMSEANLPEALLEIRRLSVEYELREETLRAVDQVDLKVYPDEIVAVVGESGCGKSTMAYATIRQVPHPGRIVGGELLFANQDLLSMSAAELRQFRWKQVAFVFQAAQNAMNPVMRIADQMIDTAQAHGESSKSGIIARASELLKMVRLDPGRVLHSYPHELSGGMKQRVIIALSLLLQPKMLILDEPTTALDVVTQVTILDILTDIRRELGLAMMLLTHDMSIVAKVADRVGVMYAGQIVEVGKIEEIYYDAKHPYTVGLINAAPSLIGDITGKKPIPGSPPNLLHLPPGCRFHPRCPHATLHCEEARPELGDIGDRRLVACHNWQSISGEA
ncbi:MAG: ABC transporter ATP-binding protein [Anaerolineae bacterium]|nr:ABC transporter ATP-binding protein [Anaerolineae bacterium]